MGTVDVGLRTQPRTQKGTNHKKRLYVWKLNTPGRSRMVKNTEKSLVGNSGQQKAKRCFTRNR